MTPVEIIGNEVFVAGTTIKVGDLFFPSRDMHIAFRPMEKGKEYAEAKYGYMDKSGQFHPYSYKTDPFEKKLCIGYYI